MQACNCFNYKNMSFFFFFEGKKLITNYKPTSQIVGCERSNQLFFNGGPTSN